MEGKKEEKKRFLCIASCPMVSGVYRFRLLCFRLMIIMRFFVLLDHSIVLDCSFGDLVVKQSECVCLAFLFLFIPGVFFHISFTAGIIPRQSACTGHFIEHLLKKILFLMISFLILLFFSFWLLTTISCY